MCKKYILVYALVNLIFNYHHLHCYHTEPNECFKNIHEKCIYDQNYSEEELQIAINYIQEKFAETGPVREPCHTMYVRKEVKCMSKKELKEFAKAYHELNRRGVLKKLVQIHDEHWPAVHKFNEGLPWHTWFNIQFQKELSKINPRVVFPYWDFALEYASPQSSIIWDYFGHSGNKFNGYCVKDGLFANLTLFYPNKHCLRRQWNIDGTVSPWESPEWSTSILQSHLVYNLIIPQTKILLNYSTKDTILKTMRDTVEGLLSLYFQIYAVYSIQIAYAAHFKTHLHLGGYHGDLSTAIAPNDPIFYLFHEYQTIRHWKWQMSSMRNLVPNSYDIGVKIDWPTKNITISNIDHDYLTYYNDVSLKETFQLGYGDLCFIPEQFIRPINDIVNNRRKIPTAAIRLKSCLPKHVFKKWFPKFALNPEGYTYFDHLFPEVGDCNNPNINGFCNHMPVAKEFESTENGRRQFRRFIEDVGLDLSSTLYPIEKNYYHFMNDLKKYDCCSPYAF